MITKVHTANQMQTALNENLEGLLTGKRKVPIVKEANNTLGKMLSNVKLVLQHKNLVGDRTKLNWFSIDAENNANDPL